jgi:hypothetical protein
VSQTIRLLFDDCLSKHAVEALKGLAAFSQGSTEFGHLVDFNLGGEIDDDWIPKIASEGWTVVTTDRGKKPSRGGKLPLLCQLHDVTHVMLSGTIHKRNTFEKIRAMFDVWPQLLRTQQEARGCGYLIRATGGQRARLECVTSPSGAEDRPKIQQRLDFRE